MIHCRAGLMRFLWLIAAVISASAAVPDGVDLFARRCAVCHQEKTEGSPPSRSGLAAFSAEQVEDALLRGKMMLPAQGLTEDQVRAIALFVTDKKLAGTPIAELVGRCSGDPETFAAAAGDWNGWGVDLTNSRYQPDSGIAPEDVPRLKLKWAFGFVNDTRAPSQPVIVGGRVFVGSMAGAVYSLDSSSGCIYWTYHATGSVRAAISVARSAKSGRWIAYFGDAHAVAHAVDAQTGKVLWTAKVDDHPAARITGSPAYYNGRLYVPVASSEETMEAASTAYECCTFRGSLVALDGDSGSVLWKTYTIGVPAKTYKTNSAGTALMGPAGAGIWSAPTIDEKRGRIYAATGNSYTGIDVATSDSVLAFDLDTGKIVWSNQVTPGDNWVPSCMRGTDCPENAGQDFDFGSSPVLRSLGGGKQIVVAAQKSGMVYGLDPDQRGKILWKTRVGVGGALVGGIAWGPAFDDRNAYVAVGDINPREKGTPGLYALRLDTGEKIWSAPAPERAGNPAQSAAVSAMPSIAFSGSFGGHLRAYSTKTGEIVWDFDAVRLFSSMNLVPAKGGSFNGGGPAIANGLVVTTSGYGFAGGLPGNVLMAFSVDGK
jgi:polyvinyl alcohol dehydrogenase (cytochrome)